MPMGSSDTTIEGYSEFEFEAMYEAALDAPAARELPQEAYDRIGRAATRTEAEGRDFRTLNEVEMAMRHMYVTR